MEQMKATGKQKEVEIDFEDKNLSEAVRTLQPAMFKDGDSYCCVLGPNPEEGVFGCGDTKEQALLDWEAHMRKRIVYPRSNDEVAQFIIDKLNASKDQAG